jgi:hypothetical protein
MVLSVHLQGDVDEELAQLRERLAPHDLGIVPSRGTELDLGLDRWLTAFAVNGEVLGRGRAERLAIELRKLPQVRAAHADYLTRAALLPLLGDGTSPGGSLPFMDTRALEYEDGGTWTVEYSWGPPEESRRSRKKLIVSAANADEARSVASEHLQGVADTKIENVEALKL